MCVFVVRECSEVLKIPTIELNSLEKTSNHTTEPQWQELNCLSIPFTTNFLTYM